MSFKIETDVPMPSAGGPSGGRNEALRELSNAVIGASIFFPKGDDAYGPAHANAVCCQARAAAGKGWFTSRQVEGGCRVWKIAEPAKVTGPRAVKAA